MKIGEIFSAQDSTALIGRALMKYDTNILTADETIYGYLGQNFSINLIEFIHEDDRKEFLKNIKRCDDDAAYFSARCKCCKDGFKEVAFVLRGTRIDDHKYIYTDMYEVGYMSEKYTAYAPSSQFYNKYICLSGDLVFVYNVKKDFVHITNGRDIRFCGSMDALRKRIDDKGYIKPGRQEKFYAVCDAVKNGYAGCQILETSFFDSDIYEPTFISYDAVVYNADAVYIAGVVSRTMFPDRSMLDPLTGIFNKREIGRLAGCALAEAVKKSQIAVFVVIDLDHFKTVNDTYGHLAGDKALINTARIIKSVIGERGHVGRIGGDEFFVVLPNFEGDHETLRAVLRSVREHIRRYFLHWGYDVRVTCSIGASSYPKDSANYEVLFKLADHCMYLAKTKGRNRFVIYKQIAHGTPEEIVNSNMKFLDYMTEEEKTQYLIDVTEKLSVVEPGKERSTLLSVMEEIKMVYGISAVQYCPKAKNGECISVSEYDILTPRTFMELYPTYADKIEKKGCLALGNYMNSGSILPDLAEYMEKNGLCSLFIAPHFDDDNNIIGVFALTSKEQYSWSEFDVNTLLILCALLEPYVQ